MHAIITYRALRSREGGLKSSDLSSRNFPYLSHHVMSCNVIAISIVVIISTYRQIKKCKVYLCWKLSDINPYVEVKDVHNLSPNTEKHKNKRNNDKLVVDMTER